MCLPLHHIHAVPLLLLSSLCHRAFRCKQLSILFFPLIIVHCGIFTVPLGLLSSLYPLPRLPTKHVIYTQDVSLLPFGCFSSTSFLSLPAVLFSTVSGTTLRWKDNKSKLKSWRHRQQQQSLSYLRHLHTTHGYQCQLRMFLSQLLLFPRHVRLGGS
jgi:hypothetical protein